MEKMRDFLRERRAVLKDAAGAYRKANLKPYWSSLKQYNSFPQLPLWKLLEPSYFSENNIVLAKVDVRAATQDDIQPVMDIGQTSGDSHLGKPLLEVSFFLTASKKSTCDTDTSALPFLVFNYRILSFAIDYVNSDQGAEPTMPHQATVIVDVNTPASNTIHYFNLYARISKITAELLAHLESLGVCHKDEFVMLRMPMHMFEFGNMAKMNDQQLKAMQPINSGRVFAPTMHQRPYRKYYMCGWLHHLPSQIANALPAESDPSINTFFMTTSGGKYVVMYAHLDRLKKNRYLEIEGNAPQWTKTFDSIKASLSDLVSM